MAGFSIADVVAKNLGLGQDDRMGADSSAFIKPQIALGGAVNRGGFEGFGYGQPFESGPAGKQPWGGMPHADTNFDPYARAAQNARGAWWGTPAGVRKLYDQYRSTGDPAAKQLLDKAGFEYPSDPDYLDRAGGGR